MNPILRCWSKGGCNLLCLRPWDLLSISDTLEGTACSQLFHPFTKKFPTRFLTHFLQILHAFPSFFQNFLKLFKFPFPIFLWTFAKLFPHFFHTFSHFSLNWHSGPFDLVPPMSACINVFPQIVFFLKSYYAQTV